MSWAKEAKGSGWKEDCKMKLHFSGLVVAMNPGPFSIQEEAEILNL
jgi:hypothetical protein